MNKRAVIVGIVVLLLVGILAYTATQRTTTEASPPQQERPLSSQSESVGDLMQDHLDDALADLGDVDERFLQP